jgi:predicted membrane protein
MHRSQWLGVALVIVGILLLLEVTGIIPGFEWIFNWWPSLLVVWGVRLIAQKPDKLTGGLFVVALGCLLLADNIIPGFDFWVAAVPVLLIVLGISIIVRPSRSTQVQHAVSFAFGNRQGSLSDELINATALFSGVEYTVNSNRFRGGTVQAIFGGIELDFRPARMATTEASLDVEAIFGGINIMVPPDWAVSIEGTPLFGSIDSKVITKPSDSTPLLRIRGTVVFGGIEIR